MQWDHYEYRIAEHYLPALINADKSGMTVSETAEFSAWEVEARRHALASGFTIGHWTDVDDSGGDWGRCDISGLFAMRCSVRFVVYKTEET